MPAHLEQKTSVAHIAEWKTCGYRIFLLGHTNVYFFYKSHVNLLQMFGDTIYGSKYYGALQKHRTKHVVYYISKHSHVKVLLTSTLLWFSEVVRMDNSIHQEGRKSGQGKG